MKQFLFLLILLSVSRGFCGNTVFFEADTVKYFKVKIPANSVYYYQTMEVISPDIFAVKLNDSMELEAGPFRVTQSEDINCFPSGTVSGDSIDLFYTSINSDETPITGHPPEPPVIRRVKFNLTQNGISDLKESVSVYDRCKRYGYYYSCFNPVEKNLFCLISVQSENRHQLWEKNLTAEVINRLTPDFKRTATDPYWAADTGENSLIFFDSAGKIAVYDYRNKTVFEVYNTREAHTSSDIFNTTECKIFGKPKFSFSTKKIIASGNYGPLIMADFDLTGKIMKNAEVILRTPYKGYDLSKDGSHVIISAYYKSRFRLAVIRLSDASIRYIDTGNLEPENPSFAVQ